MAANTIPIFTAAPRIGIAQIATANTARDGTGTLGSVFAAGTNGSLVERVRIQATGTTTAGMVRLFLFDGTGTRLLHEVLVSAITPSGTVAAFVSDWAPPGGPIPLPAGWTLKAAPHNAETFNVIAEGGDF